MLTLFRNNGRIVLILGGVFVLAEKSAYSWRFHFKANSLMFLLETVLGIFKIDLSL